MLKKSCWVAGLWLNIPDYDAPTQMVKPHERNTNYVNAVLTIPKVASTTPCLVCAHQSAYCGPGSSRDGTTRALQVLNAVEDKRGHFSCVTGIWCRGRCSPCAA